MASMSGEKSISLWLDCDTGHDDAYAILLATQNPSINLLGVSTVHGNAPLHHTTRNTCAVLEAFGCSSTIVIRGSERPLKRKPAFAPDIHGESGLDGVPMLSAPSIYDLDALPSGVERIYEHLVTQAPNSVWIVATGPLTNIARLVTEHPNIVSVIQGISIMGGAVGGGFTDAPRHREDGPGNTTPYAEFNIFVDPEAAKIVLEHPVLANKTILVTLDLSHQCRGIAAVQDRLFGQQGSPSKTRIMMSQVMNFFAETYKRQSVDMSDGPPLHDPIALFAVTDPDHVDHRGKKWKIEVVTEGEQAGRTVLKEVDRGDGGVIVPRSMNLPAFWDAVDDALFKAERTSPMQ